MKKSFSLIVFAFSGLVAMAQGINFVDLDYSQVVEQAKEEDKLIFVDVFADWCKPCLRMDAEVFPDSTLGAYFNDNFVSYKADVKYSTGNMLAKKYGVSSYPHFLFIDTKGNLVYKSRGYKSADELIEDAKVAADPSFYNKYQLYERKFNAGNRDKQMLGEFIELGHKRYGKVDPEVFKAYFDELDLMDKQEEGHIIRIAKYVPYADGRAYDIAKDYFLRIKTDTTHKDLSMIRDNLQEAVERSLKKHCKAGKDEMLDDLLIKKEELLFEVYPEDTLENIKKVELSRLHFHECAKDLEAYKEGTQAFVDAFLWDDERFHRDTTVKKSIQQAMIDMEDAAVLAGFAKKYVKFYEDKDPLWKAESWIRQAIKWDDQPEYHATWAYITDALGDKREAVDIARRALEKARSTKDPYAKDLESVLMTIVDGQRPKGINQK
ncbi:MAG: thioredoxin family protein [Saprospiraceae bacterium]|nr:thioredoxin family protein [Saprospiraceae bacterium]